MPHQGHGRSVIGRFHWEYLWQALQWLFTDVDFAKLAFRKDCTYTPRSLLATVLLWMWHDENSLVQRYRVVGKITSRLPGVQGEVAKSYQAFTKLWNRWSGRLLEAFKSGRRRRIERRFPNALRLGLWFVLMFDGSRFDVPRTASNEDTFAPRSKLAKKARGKKARRAQRKQRRRRRTAQAARERKAHGPQIGVTTLLHAATGLVWVWSSGPSDASEREHLTTMATRMSLPKNTLLVADAGFHGYELWTTLRNQQCQRLIRVAGNVRLRRGLGYSRRRGDFVYCWPDKFAKKHRPPIVLRCIVLRGPRCPVHLVTSVLDDRQLDDGLAADLYRRRWGIERFYRHCKQTFDSHKLKSRRAEHAQWELDWTLAGVWAMAAYALHHLHRRGIDPNRVRFANVVRAFRRAIDAFATQPDLGDDLLSSIAAAIIDPYYRQHKSSRDYPRKKYEPPTSPTSPPVVVQATKTQIQQAKSLLAA
jgi:hypothetical protein